jgi:hypothetical protein
MREIMKRYGKKVCAKTWSLVLTAAMAISMITVVQTGEAKVNAVSLSKKNLSLTVGKKAKITVKNTTKQKITSTNWSVNKAGKKIVKLSKKNKAGVTVSGIKKGKAVITAKIKAGKKNYQKTVKVTVTKKKDVLPVESERPSVTEEPTVTEEPKIYGEAGKISAYDAQNANIH